MLLDRRVISRVHPSSDVSSLNPERPRDGGTAEGDQSSTPDGQLPFSLRSHNQLEALSAATAIALTAFFLDFPHIPSTAIILQHEAAGNPRAPTSTG